MKQSLKQSQHTATPSCPTPFELFVAYLNRFGVRQRVRLGAAVLLVSMLGLTAQAQTVAAPVALYVEAELWRAGMEVDEAEESAQVCAFKAMTLAQLAEIAMASGQPGHLLWQAAVRYAELAWYLEPQNPDYTRLLAEFYTRSELWHPALLLWMAYASEVDLDPIARHMAAFTAAQVGHQYYRLGLTTQAAALWKTSLQLVPNPTVARMLTSIAVNTNHL